MTSLSQSVITSRPCGIERHRVAPASDARATIAVILVAMAVRLIVSVLFGADFMESYGIVVARQPSLSFFDQPPLTWWLIGATTRVFGTESAAVVRLPFIVIFALSTWLVYRITERLFTARAGFYAVCTFSFAPLFGIYDGSLAQTDCLMEFFSLVAFRCLVAILFERRRASAACWPEWIGAGLCLGLALASKYSAVLLLPGFAAFMLTSGNDRRRWLLRPQPYVAALAAGLPLLPVVIWNAEHGWISFLYQGHRAGWGDGLHVARALRWILAQVAILQPWIFAVVVAALIRGLAGGPRRRSEWFLACLSLLPLLLFPSVMLWSSHPLRGFHWGSTGYLPLIPLAGAAIDRLADRRPRLAQVWLGLSGAGYAATVLVLATHALTGWAAALAPAEVFAKQDPILLELFDWHDLPKVLRERGVDPAKTFVTATRWEECAKAGYALKDSYRLLCLSDDNIHFSFLADPAAFAGQDAIVVDRYAGLDAIRGDLDGHFASVDDEPSLALTYLGRRMTDLKIYHARDFDGTWVVAKPGSKARQ